MRNSVKAVLYSAFIFPGAGQLLLKEYYSALFFISFGCGGLYLLVIDLLNKAQDIVTMIQSGEISADLMSITNMVHQKIGDSLDSLYPALTILFITWLVSVVEAYRVGAKLEKTQ